MSAARRLVSIDVVVSGLAAQIERLCAELLPDGRRQGHEWVAPSRWGGTARSLSVHLSGVKAGIWRDFATADQGGDALNLVAALACQGDTGRALVWSRGWLGLDGAAVTDLGAHRAARQARLPGQAASSVADADQRRRHALALWLAAEPIGGTPADLYLRGRGIDIRTLPRPPNALRFHPALWCAEVQRPLPAMVAAINAPDGQHVATHRTWLSETVDQDGVVAWRKAPLTNPKKTLGSYAGGWIRLSRGAAQTSWRDVEGSETVAFCEGVENAMSVAVMMPEWRVGAAVSLANLGALKLPQSIRQVVVCYDNDPPHSAAVVALQKALRHLLSLGCSVRGARPPAGVKDWNDALRAELAEEAG